MESIFPGYEKDIFTTKNHNFDLTDFKNNDAVLREKAELIYQERQKYGLEEMSVGLDHLIINTELDCLISACNEFIAFTNYEFKTAFEDADFYTCVLTCADSYDVLFRSRKKENPFLEFNLAPKSRRLPNTRLESYVFATSDIQALYDLQVKSGARFLGGKIFDLGYALFCQTIPSCFSGNSFGYVQWRSKEDFYKQNNLGWSFTSPQCDWRKNIKEIDHCATRIKAAHRDPAILEFLSLTGYRFDFAIYVKSLNSITNVARVKDGNFALVFTSGISPLIDPETAGPTEKFVYNYNPRTHHLAFNTENIEKTFLGLKDAHMEFLLDLVGSKAEGLKQTFSRQSKYTLLVNEYIRRYDGFDGFFTKSNVTLLTEATGNQ